MNISHHTYVSWPGSSAAALADNKKPREASHEKKKREEKSKRERKRDRVDRVGDGTVVEL